MKKYISLGLVFVAVLLIMAMIIRRSNDLEEVYDGFSQQVEHDNPPVSVNNIEQQEFRLEIPCNEDILEEYILAKQSFTVSFNPKTIIPNWVAYELTADETDGPWTRKGLNFTPDPNYDGPQADHSDYKGSGYSRGHLAPAGDMKWDSVAMLESFYYTNCIPQDEKLNNGKWNQLEIKTRSWAQQYGKVFVVTGPVFYQSDTLRIGPHGIAVPHACFKALLAHKEIGYTSIAFVMRNGGETRSMSECAITVDELEALLGLDLFCNLPDELEESVESKMVMEDWIIR